ncbi:tape measure protein, partial [Leucobacter celer]|uniref:tape measure protein n=1 Tax=Leucobacter celer TaxID=668625 RepID=UPI0012FC4130
ILEQLADKGIPIYQALADQMGVTAGEVFKLASSGKINFETFQAAATAAAGTVADEMGKTTTGSFDNMMAAMGRFGATLLEDVYP